MTLETDLTVAVTGPTGTFGFGLMPLLQMDGRVTRVVGVARRAFDPGEHGWTKMDYRRGDVRDAEALRQAFDGADVVIHLAFLVAGGGERRAINVEGTLNAFRAAAQAGARRFVYASSVAAYGFHRDNPVGMTEDWPVRPAERLSYAREKAEVEQLLRAEAEAHPELDLYVLRPCIVLGPHTLGAKQFLPEPLATLAREVQGRLATLPVPVPAPVPDVPVQLVHESDVGRALVGCVVGAGPPGAYNIAADDAVSAVDLARELGIHPIAVPAWPVQAAARRLAQLPLLPSVAEWVEAASHPSVMNTTRAKTELDWTPRYTALEALREALGR
ncbi:MAG: NAD-dependent epimerase/dehydratase family protein [Actinomycetota bacterium]|nr:NAD-dependent epimerase/dehydratase family protein [Actinomycetota bacterium]